MLKRLLLAGLASLALALPAWAHSVRDLYLEEIVDGASVAFQGTVAENRVARDSQSGRIVTYTTFVVQDVLKGRVGATHTIKQLGGELTSEGIAYSVDVRTPFNVGDSHVVFLYGESPIGFSSPVGSTQGSFVVVDDAAGPMVTNGHDFNTMTAHIAADRDVAKALAKSRGIGPVKKVGLEDFKQLVRSRVGVAK